MPRIQSVPEGVYSSGDDCLDVCELGGIDLDPFQSYVIRQSLVEKADGRFAAREVCVLLARQNGKGEMILARQLFGLFVANEATQLYTAHEAKTALEAFQKLENKLRNSPLIRYVKGYRGDPHGLMGGIKSGNGSYLIELKNGNRIKFMTRTKGGGRGFTADTVYLDEAYALTEEHLAAILPTVSSRFADGNPQIWYLSSAGMVDSEVLRKLRDRGRSGESQGLAYFEWSADPDRASDDLEGWCEANPALGHRQTVDGVQADLESLSDTKFRVERLSIWEEIGGTSLFRDGLWASLTDTDLLSMRERGVVPPPPKRLCFGVDIPPERDSGVIVMASRRDDGLVDWEVVDHRNGTEWIPGRLIELVGRWRPDGVAIQGSSAASALEADLKPIRKKLIFLGGGKYAEACAAAFDAIQQGGVRHVAQEALTLAVDAARQHFRGDTAFTWSRKDVQHDISPLVACTLAHAGLAQKKRGALVL